MEVPYQAWMFARILKRYLPMERNGKIFATRKGLEKEGLNIDEIDFGIRYLRDERAITAFKIREAMELIEDDVYEDHDDRHFYISVDRKKLEKILLDAETPEQEKTSSFDEATSMLKVGFFTVQIPPYKNEYDFCRVIYRYPINNPVDWEELYLEMTGDKQEYDSKKAKRKIYDVLRSLNSKVADASNGRYEKIFVWDAKTIKRTF